MLNKWFFKWYKLQNSSAWFLVSTEFLSILLEQQYVRVYKCKLYFINSYQMPINLRYKIDMLHITQFYEKLTN